MILQFFRRTVCRNAPLVFGSTGSLFAASYLHKERQSIKVNPWRDDKEFELVGQAFTEHRAREIAIPNSVLAPMAWTRYVCFGVLRTLAYTEPYHGGLLNAFIVAAPDKADEFRAVARMNRNRVTRTAVFCLPTLCMFVPYGAIAVLPLTALGCHYFQQRAHKDHFYDITLCVALMSIMDKWAKDLNRQSPKAVIDQRMVWRTILKKK